MPTKIPAGLNDRAFSQSRPPSVASNIEYSEEVLSVLILMHDIVEYIAKEVELFADRTVLAEFERDILKRRSDACGKFIGHLFLRSLRHAPGEVRDSLVAGLVAAAVSRSFPVFDSILRLSGGAALDLDVIKAVAVVGGEA